MKKPKKSIEEFEGLGLTLILMLFISLGITAGSVSIRLNKDFNTDLQAAIESEYDIFYEGVEIESIPSSVVENRHLYGWDFNKETGVLKITNLRHGE